MSVNAPRARIATALAERLARVPATNMAGGEHVIEEFGLFVDTHRDHPHIGTFHDDIHRGQCAPMMVSYAIEDDVFIDQVSGRIVHRHDKHMFVSEEWFSNFLLNSMMAGTGDPRDSEGLMPTSHLRDARSSVYHLLTFRQVVMQHYNNAAKAGTLVRRKKK